MDYLKEIERLKSELMEKGNLIEELRYKIKKASFLLSDWKEDYSWNEKPCPYLAIEYSEGVIGEGDPGSRKAKNSLKWFWEYNRIFELIDIADNYVLDCVMLMREKRQ